MDRFRVQFSTEMSITADMEGRELAKVEK